MHCSIYEKRFQLEFWRDAAPQLSSSLPVLCRWWGSSFFRGTALISSNRKKAATNVFIVRAKIVSADQMNRTGTMITPNSIRRMVVIFSLRLDIYLNSGTRCKVQGTRSDVQRWRSYSYKSTSSGIVLVESTYRRYYGIPSGGVGNPCHQDILFHAQ